PISLPGSTGCARPQAEAQVPADVLWGGSFKMREAVIVSYARTGLAKSARGGFNITPTVSIAAHSVKHAVAKAGIEAEAVEDGVMGNVAHGGGNIARQAGLLAGLPITTSGVTVNRFCSSGLQTIGMAANHVRNDGAAVVVG